MEYGEMQYDHKEILLTSRQNPQIPKCTCPISHNTPFRTQMCIFLLLWDMGQVHHGICETGLVWNDYLYSSQVKIELHLQNI